jgi:7-keto-8-aminopelargonate synthetase-like enzyme
MVDEAHATGLYGSARRGLAEELGVGPRIEIQLGTLGKALGSAGGFVCGPRSLIEYLINRARPFVFSTAPVPAAAAAATAAVRFVQSAAGEERRKKLWGNVEAFHRSHDPKGKPDASDRRHKASAIIPLIVGEEARALTIASTLRNEGIFIPAIRYPTVARGQARLRVTLSATHERADIDRLCSALQAL